MRMTHAISSFLADMRSEGRITSLASERAYYDVLRWHSEDVNNRDPRTTSREDVKRTLQRWQNPNTQANRRAILISFYRWTVQEGLRPYNPAEQTRAPKKRKAQVYRLTTDECRRMMFAATGLLEKRAIHLGICAGLRRDELRRLQGRHFQRAGFIWVSPDIAKLGKERWIPVMAELRDLAGEIARTVEHDEYVLCGQMSGIGGTAGSPIYRLKPLQPMGATTLYNLVGNIGRRAGIAADVHPHLLRHAFCDHIATRFGLEIAQELMGHADPSTTAGYTDRPTLDQLAALLENFTFDTPRGATPLRDNQKTNEYRHGDSNPGHEAAGSPPHADSNIPPAQEGS